MEASLKNPDFKMFKEVIRKQHTQNAKLTVSLQQFGTIEKGIPAKEQSDPRGLKQKPSWLSTVRKGSFAFRILWL